MPKPVQSEIPIEGPGVSVPRYKDIDRLADSFADKCEERASISEEITKLEGRLIDAMQEHGLTTYKYRDMQVVYKPGIVHVKVVAAKPEKGSAVENENDGD